MEYSPAARIPAALSDGGTKTQEKAEPRCSGVQASRQKHNVIIERVATLSTEVKQDLQLFRELSGRFPLVRLIGKDPSKAEGPGWERYCHKRRTLEEINPRPGENLGIAMGPISGLGVDVDNPDLFESVCSRKGWEVQETRTHLTGRDRPHFLFRYPNDGKRYGNKSVKTLGFDIRGDGGQLVAPGSVHPETGRLYTVFHDAPLAEAPEWLTKTIYEDHPEWSLIQVDKLKISEETKRFILEPIPEGQRSEPMMTVITALAGAGLSDDQIYYVFYTFPIGEKFREIRRDRDGWLKKQIDKARLYAKANPKKQDPNEPDPNKIAACEKLIEETLECDFLSIEIPPREPLIDNLLFRGQNVMIFAKAGVGKTNLSTAIGAAVSRGGLLFGPYTVPEPRGVIYLDAEMPAVEMQERLRNSWIKPDPSRFKIISAELLAAQCLSVPNLVDPVWRGGILEYLKKHPEYQLLVLDNLSSLTPGCDENSGLDWDAINQWMLSIRRLGASVILVHHAGKSGAQRGISKREDQLDLVLKLSKIEDRAVSAFRVDFEKARSLPEKDKAPFVVEMVTRTDGCKVLVYKRVDEDTIAHIAFLTSKKWTQNEIGNHLGISQGAVSKKIAKAKKSGLLTEDGHLTEWGEVCCISMTEE